MHRTPTSITKLKAKSLTSCSTEVITSSDERVQRSDPPLGKRSQQRTEWEASCTPPTAPLVPTINNRVKKKKPTHRDTFITTPTFGSAHSMQLMCWSEFKSQAEWTAVSGNQAVGVKRSRWKDSPHQNQEGVLALLKDFMLLCLQDLISAKKKKKSFSKSEATSSAPLSSRSLFVVVLIMSRACVTL